MCRDCSYSKDANGYTNPKDSYIAGKDRKKVLTSFCYHLSLVPWVEVEGPDRLWLQYRGVN